MRQLLATAFTVMGSLLLAQEVVVGFSDSTHVIVHMPNGWDVDTLRHYAEDPKAYNVYLELDTLTSDRLATLLELRTNAVVLEILCTHAVLDRKLPKPWPRMEALEIFGPKMVTNETEERAILMEFANRKPGLLVALNGWAWPE
jgi:hypothetical protein